jgi:methylated-DNA-[protein]-cysteine S-methyltransferase
MDSAVIETATGRLHITATAEHLVAIAWLTSERSIESTTAPLVVECAAQLEAYFSSRLKTFSLPLAPAATAFQARVRNAMLAIPHGHTATYCELARTIGSGPRAVAQGCGANPLPIVVPCHRVVAAGGLGGYSAGAGVATKQLLLTHEAPGVLECPGNQIRRELSP